mmetsp:Transcript_67878/g.202941  ORF Transcript_67878/g.202941 Transcript_67878/m.202941 type:complete len:294 (+) Transcript_67878:534-1415(+)
MRRRKLGARYARRRGVLPRDHIVCALQTRDRMRRSKRGPEARRRLDAVIAAGGASSVGVGSTRTGLRNCGSRRAEEATSTHPASRRTLGILMLSRLALRAGTGAVACRIRSRQARFAHRRIRAPRDGVRRARGARHARGVARRTTSLVVEPRPTRPEHRRAARPGVWAPATRVAALTRRHTGHARKFPRRARRTHRTPRHVGRRPLSAGDAARTERHSLDSIVRARPAWLRSSRRPWAEMALETDTLARERGEVVPRTEVAGVAPLLGQAAVGEVEASLDGALRRPGAWTAHP